MKKEASDSYEARQEFIDPNGNTHTGSLVSDTGSPTFDHVTSGLDSYSLGSMVNKQDMWQSTLGIVNNALRGRTIVRYEYWDGTAWAAWSPTDPGDINDGDPKSTFAFDDVHSHFRVTFDFGTWRRIFAMGISWAWGDGTYNNDYDLTIERSPDDTSGSYTVQKDYGTITNSGYQDVHLGLGEKGDRYLRVEINLHNVSSTDGPGIRDMSIFSHGVNVNPDNIISVNDNAELRGNLDASGNDIIDGATTVWDSSLGEVLQAQLGGPASSLTSYPLPNSDLSNSTVTVAGNSVGLGGSTGVALGDLSNVTATGEGSGNGLDSDKVDGYDVYVQASAPTTSDPYVRFEP